MSKQEIILPDFITSLYTELPSTMDSLPYKGVKGFLWSLYDAMDKDTKEYVLDYMDVYLYALKNNMNLEKMDALANIFLIFIYKYKKQ
jgi:hypothetical protein